MPKKAKKLQNPFIPAIFLNQKQGILPFNVAHRVEIGRKAKKVKLIVFNSRVSYYSAPIFLQSKNRVVLALCLFTIQRI